MYNNYACLYFAIWVGNAPAWCQPCRGIFFVYYIDKSLRTEAPRGDVNFPGKPEYEKAPHCLLRQCGANLENRSTVSDSNCQFLRQYPKQNDPVCRLVRVPVSLTMGYHRIACLLVRLQIFLQFLGSERKRAGSRDLP